MKKFLCLAILCAFILSGCDNSINVPVQLHNSAKSENTISDMTDAELENVSAVTKQFTDFVNTVDFSVIDDIELMEGYKFSDIKNYDEEFYNELLSLIHNFDYVINLASKNGKIDIYNVNITTLPFQLAWKNSINPEEELSFEQRISLFKEQIESMKSSDRRYNSVIGFMVDENGLNFDPDLLINTITGGLYEVN